jgi:hypothetical protein
VTLVLLFAVSANAQQEELADSITLPSVAEELISMQVEDQRYRGNNDPMFDTVQWTDSLEQWVWQRQSEIDSANAGRLEELIAEYGWLGIGEVGKDGAAAVFLIVQHANLGFQEKYLPQMKESVDAHNFPAAYLAYLEDRILMRRGEPQIYGTQLIVSSETGNTELYPIEDEANVDERRAKVGLGPLADYLAGFGIDYEPVADSVQNER